MTRFCGSTFLFSILACLPPASASRGEAQRWVLGQITLGTELPASERRAFSDGEFEVRVSDLSGTAGVASPRPESEEDTGFCHTMQGVASVYGLDDGSPGDS